MSNTTFQAIRNSAIPALNLEYQEYQHRATGARHIHLAADDDHNAFMVAFLTVPQDSRGVAHILEHTSLCGSKRYPVRDPFFMMIRRSLNTFMNAFTSSDWTAYPFATRNRKDFDNLLRVYLDATFFPLLNKLDFAQEGHRLDFAESGNTQSDLMFKGVVFNEMKGAMSSPIQALAQRAQSALFPSTTYHYNSGGEPADIPSLTHQDLCDFHAQHYHPSNAVLFTFGNIPAAEHQAKFDTLALKQFGENLGNKTIPKEQRYIEPKQFTFPYAVEEGAQSKGQTHIVISWLLNSNQDAVDVLRHQIVSAALLDNSSSPLRLALETSDLGSGPSPLCGFDESTHETSFFCGLEGSDPEHAQAVEDLVMDVLKRVADEGIPKAQLDSVVHQLELAQREITGDGYPHGLRLLLDCLTPSLHGGDPVTALDLDASLEPLRKEIEDPNFIGNVIRSSFLDNPHRVRVSLEPDPQLANREAQAEAQKLGQIRGRLNSSQLEDIVQLNQELEARQEREDDPEALPKVTLADIPAELDIAEGNARNVGDMPTTWYHQGTNGLSYLHQIVDLGGLDEDALRVLPLYSSFLSEVGCAGESYADTQARQAAICGSIGARVLIRSDVSDLSQSRAALMLSGKGLNRNQMPLAELIQDTITSARFDELPHLQELVAQTRAQREDSVTDAGHALAMAASQSSFSPVAAYYHHNEGLPSIRYMKALDRGLQNAEELAALAASLQRVHELVQQSPKQALVVCEAESESEISSALFDYWKPSQATNTLPFSIALDGQSGSQAWAINSQVNFCARAYPTVAHGHEDTPILMVLGNYLTNGFLHRAVREQGGAYGAGAGYEPESGAFRFFSYRDPRLAETLQDFDRAIDWIHGSGHPDNALEEAILGLIARIDRPASPSAEAASAFTGIHFGRTPEFRRKLRAQVLDVTLDDLRRVCSSWLVKDKACTSVVGPANLLKEQSGFAIETL